MTNNLDSNTSKEKRAAWQEVPSWIKMGTVAAASALAGGLAAAWFYKKTLATLQHAENSSHSQDFQIPEEDPDDTA